jgi:hypothetical protein
LANDRFSLPVTVVGIIGRAAIDRRESIRVAERECVGTVGRRIPITVVAVRCGFAPDDDKRRFVFVSTEYDVAVPDSPLQR